MKKEEKEAQIVQFRGQYAELCRRLGEAQFHRGKIEDVMKETNKSMLELEEAFGKLVQAPVDAEEAPPAEAPAVPAPAEEVK